MKNLAVGPLIGVILGSIAGLSSGLLLFPFLFPSAEVEDVGPGWGNHAAVATGTFIHADPLDPLRYGSGGVTLYEDLLRLEQDFEVGPGPKYHVYLVPGEDIAPGTRVEESMFVDLGRLRAFAGPQSYRIPAGLDLTDYKSVVIWSEQFNELVSPAPMIFQGVSGTP